MRQIHFLIRCFTATSILRHVKLPSSLSRKRRPGSPAATLLFNITDHPFGSKCKVHHNANLYREEELKSTRCAAMLEGFPAPRWPAVKLASFLKLRPLLTRFDNSGFRRGKASCLTGRGVAISVASTVTHTARRWQSVNNEPHGKADASPPALSGDATTEAGAPVSNPQVSLYNMEQHIADAEVMLREVYGPQAKLVVQTLAQQHQRSHKPQENSGTDETKASVTAHEAGEDVRRDDSLTTLSAAESSHNHLEKRSTDTERSDDHYYRVSAAFRQLGFPVELAATKGRKPQEVIDKCLKQALNSDVEFIQPSSHNQNVYYSRNKHSHSKSSALENKGRPHAQGHPSRKHGNRRRHAMSPHQLELKAILDELRQLCCFFSRNLKFSIRPSLSVAVGSSSPAPSSDLKEEEEEEGPALGGGVTAANRWRCRAYVKNDWSAVSRTFLALETTSSSPNEAFSQCVAELRRRYREEANSDEVMLESVREVELLEPPGRCVEATCAQEAHDIANTPPDGGKDMAPSQGGAQAETADEGKIEDAAGAEPGEALESFMRTYCASVRVEDENGNVTVSQTRRQPTQIQAYQSAAQQAIRSRSPWGHGVHLLSESLGSTPLLLRMRWQFDAMVTAIAELTGKQPHEVAEIRLERVGSSPSNQPTQDGTALLWSSALPAHCLPPTSAPSLYFRASFSCDGALVWESTSGGRYRVEFDTYVQALHYLLDQYGDLTATWTHRGGADDFECQLDEGSYSNVSGILRMGDACVLFPSSAMLQLAVELHDRFNIFKNHNGKWNCYALLGTITSRLLGNFYQTSYSFNEETKEWWATLTVNDGVRTDQVLVQRSSKQKGEAWRLACLAALRENFPQQYEEVIRRYPDVDLSGDTLSRSSRFRALPREKRIQHLGDLFALVSIFAEEDLGWTQLRIRLRNASGDIGLPQWIAEMEAQVEGEEGRRVVAMSPPYAQIRNARRALLYRVAKAFLPKELAIYQQLQRSDSQDPDTDPTVRRTRLYQVGGPPFLWQLCALLGARHPSLEPITWQIRLRPRVDNNPNGNTEGSLSHPPSDEELGEWLSVLSEGSPLALLEILSSPDQLHQPLSAHFTYAADVLGANDDVHITEYHGGPSESAIDVLTATLKAASKQLGGADAEVLWTEFETHSCPPMSHPKELALYLFHAFFGDSGAAWGPTDDAHSLAAWRSKDAAAKPVSGASATEEESTGSSSNNPQLSVTRGGGGGGGGDSHEATLPSITNASVLSINTVQLGNYWVSTVCLRHLGMLPIARAIAATKRGSIMDVLTLAARYSFGRPLRGMAKHQPAVSALATELLTDPVVERLSEVAVRDVLAQVDYEQNAGRRRLSPFKLLLRCMYRDYRRQKRIRAQQSQEAGGGSFQCRLYLQPDTRQVKKGDVQLVGFGSAIGSGEALNQASLMALKNLFPEDAAMIGTARE